MAILQNEQSCPQGDALSHTPEEYFSATEFASETDLYSHVLGLLRSATHHKEIVYSQVPLDWGKKIFELLDEHEEGTGARKHWNVKTQTLWIRTMPTEVLDCHQEWVKDEMGDWLLSGRLTRAEFRLLRIRVGSIIDFTYPPYAGSRKEPDSFVRPDNQPLPTVVIESGWSESYPRLLDDMNLWLVGGNGTTKATIILKWKKLNQTNKVEGTAEFYTLDINGMPVMRQREGIFPKPPPQQAITQEIRLTRGMLFGPSILPGKNPNDVFGLHCDRLRELAGEALSLMGLQPA